MKLWAEARVKAKRFIKIMEDEGYLPVVVVPESDEAKAKVVLEEMVTICLSPLTHAPTKVAAGRTVLEWTKSKPVQKTAVALSTAEEWLNAVLTDNANGDGSRQTSIAEGTTAALPDRLRVLGTPLLQDQNQGGNDCPSGAEPCAAPVSPSNL
jgi:hypothetical protein